MKIEELKKQYLNIPDEMKKVNRWICYNIITDEATGEKKKVPMCAFNGGYAKSNDKNTWTNFDVACLGCVKFNFYGLGFILGDGFFGVDIDNHPDKNGKFQLSDNDFKSLANEFISALNSYTEYSYSGKGIHIICKGSLPPGARRRVNVPIEMYDSKRFFTMSGKTIKSVNIADRTKEILPLYNKYLKKEEKPIQTRPTSGIVIHSDDSVSFGGGDFIENITIENTAALSDREIIDKITSSKNGEEFVALYNGNMSSVNNDHSAADARLCQILAFWTGNNQIQMDRIFRNSGLYRDKWNRSLGQGTYGSYQIEHACNRQVDVYTPKKEVSVIKVDPIKSQKKKYVDNNGDPLFGEIKQVFNHFDLTDTGNAEMFYAYFGENFRYNSTNKYWMYYTGIKWDSDKKMFIKKYADKLIDIMKSDKNNLINKINELIRTDPESPKIKELNQVLTAVVNNIKRISNSGGKEAMIKELEHLHNIPILNKEFDTDDFILNTDSGIVNLETGEITPHSKEALLSKSTNCEIDLVNEPKRWIQFLYEIFERNNKEETKEIVDCFQKAIGYTLSGSVEEQCMFFLYGDGKNGKSVLINIISKVMGDYATSIDSEMLSQNKNNSAQATQFSLADLEGSRLVTTTETEEGKKMNENLIKKMTGDDLINAQVKFGNPFKYEPHYKIWEATNNLPNIKGGYASWRRIFLFPFLIKFEGTKADRGLKRKLLKELPQILGWCVKGFQKYFKEGLEKPKCLEEALSDYKQSIDTVQKYLNNCCQNFAGYNTSARNIYVDYKTWCNDNHEFPILSESMFSNNMKKKGYEKIRTGSGYVYQGIILNSNEVAHSFENDED